MRTTNHEEAARHALLEAAVHAATPAEFERALVGHGAVDAHEVGTLAEIAAHDARSSTRRNAARLLALAPPASERDAALRRLLGETDDPAVWAAAMDAMRGADDASALAGMRPALVGHALADDDPGVRRVALWAAARSGHPAASAAIERALDDPDARMRTAALEAAAQGDASLRARLPARLAAEHDPAALRALVAAVARDAAPAVQEALVAELFGGDVARRTVFADALRDAFAPWMRERLLPLARTPGPRRRVALQVLGAHADDPDVVRACVALYEAMPPRGDPAFTTAALERAPCDDVVSRLVGRRVFGEEALGAAREWLTRRDVQ